MEEKRTLIETFLPVEEISAEAKKEKLGNAKPARSMLHYWWTRKPLIASRATVLGALLPENYDINDFKKLLYLNKDKRSHNYNLKKSEYEKIRKYSYELWDTESPTIMDPFAGGGSIPFEALRMGCNVIANDYNPVSYLILKGSLEFPLKYKEKLLKDVSDGLKWIFDKSYNELKDFYPKYENKDVAAYIHAWVVKCPDCGLKNPLVGQWSLSRKKKIFLDPYIEGNIVKFKIKTGDAVPDGTVKRGNAKCIKCGNVIKNDIIKKEIFENNEEILLALVLLDKNGKSYVLPDKTNIDALEESKKFLEKHWDLLIKEDLIPLEEMPEGEVPTYRYLKYWYRILNPRQLILFSSLIRYIRLYSSNLNKDDEYKRAVIISMSFILGKHIDYNCRSTSWHRLNQQIAHALTTRRPSMFWDHSEVNPFVKSSGTLIGMINDINKALKYSVEKLESNTNILIENKSITELELNTPIIVTDPPYFDDVQYAELSEFFYVFEKRALKNIIKLPLEIQKSEDLSVGKKRSKDVFEHLFNVSCQKMNSLLTENGILIMYFAHSSVKAWDFVVNSLRTAKFRITATWPIHTENPNNPLSRGNASIMSSIVIVARKRKEDKTGYIEEIKGDVEEHLKARLQEFWDYGLRGADITVSAMGATLDILTQYSEIKSYTGEMTVKDILELVEIYVVEYILEKFLKNSESLDSPTRFYTYCRLSELDGMSFDTANLISKSLSIDLKLLESSGNISSITKGSKKGIKILKFDEREDIEVKNLIDAVQLGMLAYDKGGMREFESVLADIPYSQGEIFNILESFQHLESGDPEKQIALQILGKSADLIPEKGQTTFD
ncbi:DUF1156 domain-containing protein [Methanobacterium alkalithermotolerans]|uniref:site-specific DNA-methyltransferase (adenine-specific) n=1 Tax=Methanobacterium alkalithermotolerans TaxID=2731220 RepID=A0A8T8K385_9EURY|nr:DUF1156 domain-containing protein [Methanobacterium alkalithermotolerans]QUH22359.1 DUF1156 domain-containing protein [Methanobacterium alkalithermotolerans]